MDTPKLWEAEWRDILGHPNSFLVVGRTESEAIGNAYKRMEGCYCYALKVRPLEEVGGYKVILEKVSK